MNKTNNVTLMGLNDGKKYNTNTVHVCILLIVHILDTNMSKVRNSSIVFNRCTTLKLLTMLNRKNHSQVSFLIYIPTEFTFLSFLSFFLFSKNGSTQNKGSLSDFHGCPAVLRRPCPQRQGNLWLTLITAILLQESGLRMISHHSG